MVAIKKWGLEHVVIVTVDNISSNDAIFGHIKNNLRETNKSIMDGEYLHVRFGAHILNLIVINDLKDFDDLVASVKVW